MATHLRSHARRYICTINSSLSPVGARSFSSNEDKAIPLKRMDSQIANKEQKEESLNGSDEATLKEKMKKMKMKDIMIDVKIVQDALKQDLNGVVLNGVVKDRQDLKKMTMKDIMIEIKIGQDALMQDLNGLVKGRQDFLKSEVGEKVESMVEINKEVADIKNTLAGLKSVIEEELVGLKPVIEKEIKENLLENGIVMKLNQMEKDLKLDILRKDWTQLCLEDLVHRVKAAYGYRALVILTVGVGAWQAISFLGLGQVVEKVDDFLKGTKEIAGVEPGGGEEVVQDNEASKAKEDDEGTKEQEGVADGATEKDEAVAEDNKAVADGAEKDEADGATKNEAEADQAVADGAEKDEADGATKNEAVADGAKKDEANGATKNEAEADQAKEAEATQTKEAEAEADEPTKRPSRRKFIFW